MNRSISKFPERLPDTLHFKKKKVYEIQLITPLFGGGVEGGKVDSLTPIHGTAIRGQLRFWWRASRGARFETTDALKEEEGKIWGTTDKKSPVSLAVDIVNNGTNKSIKEYSSMRYVLFPFMQEPKRKNNTSTDSEDKKPNDKTVLTNLRFRLILEYPEWADADVEAALWVWINFGGIGARTRRGCGALYCQDLSPAEKERIHDWYRNNLKKYQISLDGTREWATLPERLLVQSQKKNPIDSWQDAVNVLKKFRQGPGPGRAQGRGNRPGKSNWPEAAVIRELAGENKRRQGTLKPVNDWFPRAELGMPIVFQRTLKKDNPELLPENKNRMASPLVLKPLALSAQQAVPIILKLTTPGPGNAELKKLPNNKPVPITEKQIREINPETVPNSPLKRFASRSALEAFLKYAMSEEGGYK